MCFMGYGRLQPSSRWDAEGRAAQLQDLGVLTCVIGGLHGFLVSFTVSWA